MDALAEPRSTIWAVAFWCTAAYLLIPLPFKMLSYASRSDSTPLMVKLEDGLNLTLLTIGLVGFYGYVYGVPIANSVFWLSWLVITVIVSITAPSWSPKIKYATELTGRVSLPTIYLLTVLLAGPMFLAVYLYATSVLVDS